MRTLLLADDSVTVQRVIALTFADQQISVVTCGDGQQAMERMTAQRPDIVLAGTTLPQVSGYDLARYMRSRPELRDVPVLLLTGAFETVDDVRLKASGANGVIEKPVEPNNVIGRVKELLGMRSESKPATAGRLVTSADGPEQKLPVATTPRAVTSMRGTPAKWEQPRDQTGLEAKPQPVEDASVHSGDYFDTLDAAFDTLDQQLSGRVASAKPSRNPSGPLGQSVGAPDPRSPGRRPQNGANPPGNPVFEVDDDWFGGADSASRADARSGRREMQDDLRAPELQPPPPEAAAAAVFEVDDDWFAEDNKARAAKQLEHRVLAAEMGIHEVELPHAEPVPHAPAPPSDLDFDFGLDDIKKLRESAPTAIVADPPPAAAPAPPVVAAPVAPAPVAPAAFAPAPVAPVAPFAPASVMPTSPIIPLPPVATASASSRDVADDFAQLLAFEQGEHHEPPTAAPPEITEEMLGDIVSRVTARLNTGAFIEQLRTAMTATVIDTAREIATATSERLAREIATATSERLVREIATVASERLVRDIATATSARVVHEIASETSERLVRDIATNTSERLVREIATDTSERLVREIATDTSERLVRDIATDTSERLARDIATETSERVVRGMSSDITELIVRDVAAEASDRIVREVAVETSERLVRGIVSETSERLVRDEIERIKNKPRP